jgi:hypothetical protein
VHCASCGAIVPPIEWLKREHLKLSSSLDDDQPQAVSNEDKHGDIDCSPSDADVNKEVHLPVVKSETVRSHSSAAKVTEWQSITHQMLGEQILSGMMTFKWTYLDKHGRTRNHPKNKFYEHIAPQVVSHLSNVPNPLILIPKSNS